MPIEQSKQVLGASVTDSSLPETPRKEEFCDLQSILNTTRAIGLLDDDIVEVVLATYISKELGRRDPLWLMLVGSPSSNKTQLVSLLAHAEDTYMLDTLTSNPFISGMAKKEKPQDLLPLLDEKCFIVKDYTSFFGKAEETVKQLISDLVSIYDGSFAKHSGARGTVRYKTLFSHIGCVTPMGLKMRQQYMNMVGARFLTIRIPELTAEQKQKCFGIAWSIDFPERLKSAQQAATAFANALCKGVRSRGAQIEPIAKELQDQLNVLSELVALSRGEVKTRIVKFVDDEGKEQSFEELEDLQKEEPFRALNQLRKLCIALAILREKEEVSIAEIRTAQRVALSSMPPNRAEVLQAFKSEPKMSAMEVADVLGKKYRSVKRYLDQLTFLGVLHSEKDIDGKTRLYEPDKRFAPFILSL